MALPAMAIPIIGKVIDAVFPDKAKADEAKAKLIQLEQDGAFREMEAKAGVVRGEAQSEHWLVAAWRPITMLVFVAIIANNYIIYPYLSLFWDEAPVLEIPADLWDLLKIGIGGYITGRTVEKAVKVYKTPPPPVNQYD